VDIYRLNCARHGQWYAIKINSFKDDLENLEVFVEEGTLVAYCDDLESAADDLGIDIDKITLVDPNEN